MWRHWPVFDPFVHRMPRNSGMKCWSFDSDIFLRLSPVFTLDHRPACVCLQFKWMPLIRPIRQSARCLTFHCGSIKRHGAICSRTNQSLDPFIGRFRVLQLEWIDPTVLTFTCTMPSSNERQTTRYFSSRGQGHFWFRQKTKRQRNARLVNLLPILRPPESLTCWLSCSQCFIKSFISFLKKF